MARTSLSAAQPDSAPDIQDLRSKVQFMDDLSQSGFDEISAVAKLALSRLETPDGHRFIEDIAMALRMIRGKADEIRSCINHEAEEVGCAYVDEARKRRYLASRAAREA